MDNKPNRAKVSISLPSDTLHYARTNAHRAGRSLSNYVAFAIQRLNTEVETSQAERRRAQDNKHGLEG